MGGASANASAPELPKAKPMQGALELLRSYGGDNFFKQNSYKVIDSLGKQITGKLDGNGFAQVTGIAPGPAKVVLRRTILVHGYKAVILIVNTLGLSQSKVFKD